MVIIFRYDHSKSDDELLQEMVALTVMIDAKMYLLVRTGVLPHSCHLNEGSRVFFLLSEDEKGLHRHMSGCETE